MITCAKSPPIANQPGSPSMPVTTRTSPSVRSNVSGVELIEVVGATGVTAGASAFEWTAVAPGVGQSAEAGRSFMAVGASIACRARRLRRRPRSQPPRSSSTGRLKPRRWPTMRLPCA